MKNLIRITVFAFIIVMAVFAVQCSTAKQDETTTDSTEVVSPADSVSADSILQQVEQ